ncbi:MAG: PD-(D/E)XK nuclease family protein [Bacteriovoracia bacterium]
MTKTVSEIRLTDVQGLSPRVWLCLGAGISREEVKAYFFRQGAAMASHAVLSWEELALRCLPEVAGGRTLGPVSRQRVLKQLLAKPGVGRYFPELKRLRRQRSFFRKLDRSLHSGRLSFAHEQEEAVLHQRLDERFGKNPVREEIRVLSRAWDAWLAESGQWDMPRLLREATQRLREGLPSSLGVGASPPDRIVFLSVQDLHPVQAAFREELAHHVEVAEYRAPVSAPADPAAGPRWDWQQWHTPDDAADALADQLAMEVGGVGRWERATVLIPDDPAYRRSVARAFAQRGLPLENPRDPTLLRYSEALKLALQPLRLVAEDFPRAEAISWLRRARSEHPECGAWIQEILSRGIRQGLNRYRGGNLVLVHEEFSGLKTRLGGKLTATEMALAHLQELKSLRAELPLWVPRVLEQAWGQVLADQELLGLGSQRAPARHWQERLGENLEQMPPPVPPLRPRRGVVLHRLGQAPIPLPSVEEGEELFCLGLPAQWLDPAQAGASADAGDYWFSARERESLAQEFGIRSPLHVVKEKKASIQAWLGRVAKVTILESQYDWDGAELESAAVVWTELGCALASPEIQGAHSRWQASFRSPSQLQPQEVSLPEVAVSSSGLPRIRASELDRYSRCAFQALGSYRWRLGDRREPMIEPWPEYKGRLLHKAVELLLLSRQPDGEFSVSVEAALERAWEHTRPQGMLDGRRLRGYAHARYLKVLHLFTEEEKRYWLRAKTEILSVERAIGGALTLNLPEAQIYGVPDRVDAHRDGVLIIDYKTSSAVPTGERMLQDRYRLQLPAYALAAQEKLGHAPLGVQFVQLDRTGARGRGVFFSKWNGKSEGSLTDLTRRSKSLMPEDRLPDQVWQEFRAAIQEETRAYLAGRFTPHPKDRTECDHCSYYDLCGRGRLATTRTT